MTWFRLDDTWLTHPKVQAAGLKGRALWLAGGLHCAQHLTDGRIPKTALPMLAVAAQIGSGRKEAALLIEVGLWSDDGDSYVVNDYLTYQPSRAKVEDERAKAAERQRKLRESRRDNRCDDAVSHASPIPSRTRPTGTTKDHHQLTVDAVDVPVVDHAYAAIARYEASIAYGGAADNPEGLARTIEQRLRTEGRVDTLHASMPDLDGDELVAWYIEHPTMNGAHP